MTVFEAIEKVATGEINQAYCEEYSTTIELAELGSKLPINHPWGNNFEVDGVTVIFSTEGIDQVYHNLPVINEEMLEAVFTVKESI